MATISYVGSDFTQKVKPCHCGKPAVVVKAHVFNGKDIMNTNTGETYLECSFSFFCREHEE